MYFPSAHEQLSNALCTVGYDVWCIVLFCWHYITTNHTAMIIAIVITAIWLLLTVRALFKHSNK